ncbi:uncharacterized protein BO97DRAFT_406812 [Aspergillus homomorphus CBS 101889]|uniref:U3-containing 90S pre-ribosomal complex subunit-domain containing protein n=1 Tax=Aspergillus homomorphus (strain CBS 101889) TaxID=1450537 RepID=A0A395HRW4_ASPHC|nr:hypothetical protein BO97DRAFT_406812 [Aspergillus homomorphus CBS 101889]RAL10557.1 hypothetical protein BO97DRAFT_406812 [Aspergillus homomorphus CBS 101889]
MSDANAKPTGLAAKVDKKRKRQAEESNSKPEQTKSTGNNASEGPNSNKKRKNNNKGKFDKKGGNKGKDSKDKAKQPKEPQETKATEVKGSIDEAIGKMDGRLLADHFAQKVRRHNKEITAVELSDLSVPDSAFLDTSSFDSPRNLENLPAFLKAFSPEKGSGLAKSSEEKGTPHTLVIAGAGLRAADVVRALRSFQNKESIVGKLFAKHIKLDEAKQFLERARMGIGAGTPARISDLIDSGSLKLGELERIVIDGSYVDQKQRGIFDMKETHLPLLQLLTRPEFKDRYGAKQKGIKILVF